MRKHQTFRPVLEALESRLTPACTAVKTGSLLTITGDNFRNVATITDAGTQITVTCENISNKVFTGINDVVIRLGLGNDKLTYTISENALNGLTRTINAVLGPAGAPGNTAIFNVGILNAANLSLNVKGDVNDDFVTVGFNKIGGGSKVNLTESLFAGRDPSSVSYNGSITGAGTQVFAKLNLGTGNNKFTTNFGAGGIFLNNDSWVLKETVIGSNVASDKDNIRAFLNGRVDSEFNYDVILGAGNDTSTLGVAYNIGIGFIAFGGRLHIGMNGGAGNDSLVVNHTLANGTVDTGGNFAFVGHAGSLLEVVLNGGAGNDQTTVNFGDGGFQIDAGAQVRILVNGDSGTDDDSVPGTDSATVLVEASSNSNLVSASDLEIVVFGGGGADTLVLTFTNLATHGFASVFTEVDGGEGFDTCIGNPVAKRRCEA